MENNRAAAYHLGTLSAELLPCGGQDCSPMIGTRGSSWEGLSTRRHSLHSHSALGPLGFQGAGAGPEVGPQESDGPDRLWDCGPCAC